MSEHLQNVIERSDQALVGIQAALSLINTTYGAGCVDHGGQHPDHVVINQAARTLAVQLLMLKHRAATLLMYQECSDETRKKVGVIL